MDPERMRRVQVLMIRRYASTPEAPCCGHGSSETAGRLDELPAREICWAQTSFFSWAE